MPLLGALDSVVTQANDSLVSSASGLGLKDINGVAFTVQEGESVLREAITTRRRFYRCRCELAALFVARGWPPHSVRVKKTYVQR